METEGALHESVALLESTTADGVPGMKAQLGAVDMVRSSIKNVIWPEVLRVARKAMRCPSPVYSAR